MGKEYLKKGYLYSYNQIDEDIQIALGRAIAGAAVGILVLDLGYPYLPGNVANASTYNFPVRFKILKGTSIPQILSHDPALLEAIIEGGRELQQDGVRAIVGACGYFGYYQKQAAATLEVPVFLSSLLQVPILKQTLQPGEKVGVICADLQALSNETLAACGIEDPSELVIVGASGLPEFRNILEATCHFNPAQMERELVGLAQEMIQDNPEVGVILLECSDMPPFAWSIQNATGRAVFDFITMINWIQSGVVQRPYHGVI